MIKICTATFDNLRLARLWNRAIKVTCTDEHETEIYYADNPPLVADFETPWSDCRIPNSGRPAVAACYRAMPQEGQRIFIEEDIIPLREWSIDDYPGDPGILCGIKRNVWFSFSVYRTGFATALSKGFTPIIQQHAREMEKPDWIDCDLWNVILEADAKIVGDHFVHVDRVSNFHASNPAKQLLIDALDALIPQIETPIPRPIERPVKQESTFLKSVINCEHRGEVTRQLKCKLCGDREKIVNVFNCTKFNVECTIDPHQSGQAERVCKRCEIFD